MALRAHPTIPSDLTQEKAFESNTSIIHALSSYTQNLTLYYLITTRSILPTFTQDKQGAGYGTIYFTLFYSEAACTRLYSKNQILNTISIRLYDTNPPTFPSLASWMSTYPSPTTPPTHNSLSNKIVESTTALIAIMHQSLHKNGTMIA